MAIISYADNRNALAYSYTFEIQKDNLRPAGKTASGLDKFIYVANTPLVVKKITERWIGTEDFWNNKIDQMILDYEAITSIQTGLYTENISVSDGYFIIDGTEFFAGTISSVDLSKALLSTPPAEFKIVESYSASIAPSGYMPITKKAFYSSKQAAKVVTKSSTMLLSLAQSIVPGGDPVITAASFSNLREISGLLYVDASITFNPKIADVSIL